MVRHDGAGLRIDLVNPSVASARAATAISEPIEIPSHL
jgi:hypothetical protein